MSLSRLSPLLLFALALLAGCTWDERPDGADAVHTDSDGYFDEDVDPTETPLGGSGVELVEPVDSEILEPVGDGAGAPAGVGGAPVPLDQPVPTTGTEDNTSEVEEALTPGTEY